MAFGGPAELAAASGTGDDFARVRLVEEIHLQVENPLVANQADCPVGEFGVFLKEHGGILYRTSQVARNNTECYNDSFAEALPSGGLPSWQLHGEAFDEVRGNRRE